MELYHSFDEVKKWIKELDSGQKSHPTLEIVEDSEFTFKVNLYTLNHKYSIKADDKSHEDGSRGYLGCIVKNRKSRPGELQLRGNDLPDGHFTKTNWENIKIAIIKYELEEVIINYTAGG